MYAEYFGLSEPPFSIAPDPRYLYPSAQHLEALAHLAYGATEGDGFIQLTGEVGTGKTTLIRRLLSEMPEGVEIAFLFNPEVSRRGLLTALLAELGLPRPPPGCEHSELLARLYRHLLAARARGRRVVLVIDEAQRLGPEVLEEVRLLTNFETDRRKLLNVILVGQPELRDTLARPDLRQLAQRITARYHLGPFTVEETDAYIRHRLRVAGAPGRIFKAGAVRVLHRHSRGIPRLINLICDRSLMAACTRGLREVNAAVVREAVRELAGATGADKRRRWPLWQFAGLAVAALGGAALAWWLAAGSATTSVLGGNEIAAAVAAPAVNAISVSASTQSIAATASTADSQAAPVTEAVNPIQQWLAGLPASTQDAATVLLAMWGAKVLGANPADPCAVATRAGLACLNAQGNLNLLRAFNLPAVVSLNVAGNRYRVVVGALDAEQVTLIAPSGATRAFPLAAFGALWYGRMWLLWRPPNGVELMQRGMRGPAVAWLRQALALPAAGTEPVYDLALEDAVRAFQRRHALVPDGIAGPETLIVLRHMEDAHSGPTLQSSRRMNP